MKNSFYIIVFLVSVVVGLIYGSPHFFRKYFLEREGLTYSPLSLIAYFDETNVTGPRMREILDGHYRVSEIDIFEHIGAPSFMPILPPLLMAPFLFVTNSVDGAMMLADFVFPLLFAWVFYGIGFYLFHEKKWFALFFTVVASLFTYCALYIFPPSFENIKILVANFLPFQHGLWRDRLSLTLMESFIPDFILFGPALLCLLVALLKEKTRYFVVAGIFLGGMFYTYFFHWVFFVVVVGFLGLFFLLRKEYTMVKKLALTLAIGAALSFYYFYQYALVLSIPYHEQITSRVWVERSHSFRLSDWPFYCLALVLSFIVYRISKQQDSRRGLFLIALLFSGIVVLNLQVVAGFNVAPYHWTSRTNVFGLLFAYFYLLFYWANWAKDHSKKTHLLFICSGIILSLSLFTGAFHSQYTYAHAFAKDFVVDKDFAMSLQWLDKNISNDAVILTPSLVTNYFIPLYTRGRIFLPRAINSFASEDEMMDRLFIVYRLFNIPVTYLAGLLDAENNNFSPERERLEYYERRGLLYFFNARILSTELDGHKQKGKYVLPTNVYSSIINTFQNYPFYGEQLLKKYKIDYIYVGPRERGLSSFNFEKFSYLNKVYDHNGITIYKYTPTPE